MELRYIEVDHNFRERIRYNDASFPLDINTDIYGSFVDETINIHWHDAFEYGVVLSGEVEYYIGENHVHLVRGDVIFINSNTMHMARQSAGCTDAVMYTVVFPSAFFTDNIADTVYQKYIQPVINQPIPGFLVDRSDGDGKAVVKLLDDAYYLESGAFGYELRLTSLLSDIWYHTISYISATDNSSFIQSTNTRSEERVKNMLLYIHEHYTENITVDELAAAVNISRSECFRSFKRITCRKPVEYINDYRLAQAGKMLLETSMTISEICTACGFGSSSYFGKLFKAKCGVSPKLFRRGMNDT